jgi:hypothetical protein
VHEVSTQICSCITRALHWINTEVHETHRYDGLTDVNYFFRYFELQILDQHIFLTLDVALKATPTRWWVAHK